MRDNHRSTHAGTSGERRESVSLLQSAQTRFLRPGSARDRAVDWMNRPVGHYADRLPVQNLLGSRRFEIFERITGPYHWPRAEKVARGPRAPAQRTPNAVVQN